MSCRPWMMLLPVALALNLAAVRAAEEKPAGRSGPITIARPKSSGQVDFERQILPFLRPNCLPCHNRTAAKGGLNLETPEQMLHGGNSGPAIVAKKSSASLMLKTAAHQDPDTIMPPVGNKAQAMDLSPEQLGLLKVWIDQGAKGTVSIERQVTWQPLSDAVQSIMGVALTQDGQFAACTRGNQVAVYHLPSSNLVARLSDPALVKSGLYQRADVAHRDVVDALAMNGDGSYLATSGYREVKIWHRSPDVPQATLNNAAHREVSCVALSADGVWIATGGDDGAVRIWERAKNKVVRTIATSRSTVRVLEFSPDGRQLLIGNEDGSLQVWNVADGKSLSAVTKLEGGLIAAVWMPGTSRLAVAGKTGAPSFWEIPVQAKTPLTKVGDVVGFSGTPTALATLSTNSNALLIGDAEGRVRWWNLAGTNVVREFKHGAPVTSVAVSADGRRMAAAGGPVAHLWDAADARQIAELKGDRRLYERVAAQEALFNFSNGETNYHKASIQNIEKQQAAVAERIKKATEAMTAATKTFDEKQAALKTANESKVNAEKDLAALNEAVKKAADAFSAAEQAAKAAEAEVKQFKEKSPNDQPGVDKLQADLTGKTKAAADAKAAADKATNESKDKIKQANEKVATTTKGITEADAAVKKAEMTRSQAENELNLANAAAKREEENLAAAKAAQQRADETRKQVEADLQVARKAAAEAEKPIKQVAFSGSRLITTGDDAFVHAWSQESGAPYEVMSGGAPGRISVSAPGLLLVAEAGGKASVRSVDSGWVLERTIGGDANSPFADRVNALTFSPDGKWLATGGGEPSRSSEIHIWEVATGKLAYSFRNIHSDAVLSLDFSPDMKYLASGGADRFARVVEIATGKVARSFEGHTHHVQGVSWKCDGRTLASAGADNVVKVWDFVTGDRKKNVVGFEKEVTSVHFVGFTDQMLATGGDARVRLLKEDGNEARSYGGSTDFMTSSAVTPDGRIVIAGGYDGVLRVWKGSGELLALFPPPPRPSKGSEVSVMSQR